MRIIRIHRNSMPANLRVYVKHLLAIPVHWNNSILIPLFQLLKRSQKDIQFFLLLILIIEKILTFVQLSICTYFRSSNLFHFLKLQNEKFYLLMYYLIWTESDPRRTLSKKPEHDHRRGRSSPNSVDNLWHHRYNTTSLRNVTARSQISFFFHSSS